MSFQRLFVRAFQGLTVVLLMAVLAGCGGGKNAAPAPVVNATMTYPGTIAFGQKSQFQITGSNLRSARVALYDPFDDGYCEDVVELGRTNNSIIIECTPRILNFEFKVYNSNDILLETIPVTVAEPDIRVNNITAASDVTIGAVSRFTIEGQYLAGYLVLLPESTGCDSIRYVSNTPDDTQLVISCIPTSRTPKFVVTAKKDFRVVSTTDVDLSSAPVGPASTNAVFASIDALLNSPSEFTVEGYFFGSTRPQVTSENCSDISVDTARSDAVKIVLTCTPTALDVKFFVKDLDNPGDGDTTSKFSEMPSRVLMVTSKGNITIALAGQRAPVTVGNFLQYVNDGYYSGTLFHRLTKSDGNDTTTSDFGINQGGGFTSKDAVTSGVAKPGQRAAIALETTNVTGLSNTAGSIAMARTNSPNSATSQFYFNVSDNSQIFDYASGARPGYAVFGMVLGQESLDTLAAINAVSVDSATSIPTEDITIISATQTQ